MTRRLLLLLFVTALSLAGCSRGAKSPTAPGKVGGPLKGTARAEAGATVGDTISLPFGGGTNFHIVVSTPTSPDTTGPDWYWSWSLRGDAADFLLVDQRITPTGQNFVIVQGSIGGSPVAGSKINYTVIDTSSGKADTILQGVVPIKFKRIVQRDIQATANVYHLTRSIAGVIVAKTDSMQAEFHNNDQDLTLLRAGPITIGGIPMTERHRPVGQDYVGAILFKPNLEFEVRNTVDLRSQVPTFSAKTFSPGTELVVIAPNGRWPVTSHEPLVFQWSGAEDTTITDTVSVDTLGAHTTTRHSSFVDFTMTDIAGAQLRILALDNGRHDVSVEQLHTLTPGLIRVVGRRVRTKNFPNASGGSPSVNLTLNFIVESRSTFYLQP